MEKWTSAFVGPQLGKSVIVTGGTAGIGLEVARELARNGAFVILGADDELKGKRVEKMLRAEVAGANVKYEYLNLADLHSIDAFVERIRDRFRELHVLVNNAGIAAIPERLETVDGREMTFAVNYLGHFALTAKLFDLLWATPDARIIFQSGLDHAGAELDFFDLEGHFTYDSRRAYAQSKLAVLVFALELQRRIERAHLNLRSIPVHPGVAKTGIFNRGPVIAGKAARAQDLVEKFFLYAFGQSASMGALPTLFAATSHLALGGHYYGPDGLYGRRGHPTQVRAAEVALDEHVARRLWEESERLTGVRFDLEAPDEDNVLVLNQREADATRGHDHPI